MTQYQQSTTGILNWYCMQISKCYDNLVKSLVVPLLWDTPMVNSWGVWSLNTKTLPRSGHCMWARLGLPMMFTQRQWRVWHISKLWVAVAAFSTQFCLGNNMKQMPTLHPANVFSHWQIQDFHLGGRSNAKGASIEAPQVMSGVGFGKGEWFGERDVPLPEIFWISCLRMVHFAYILTHD